MDFYDKYIKYKRKYNNAKRGGNKICESNMNDKYNAEKPQSVIPPFVPKYIDNAYTNFAQSNYQEIISILNTIDKSDLVMLKLGTSDVQGFTGSNATVNQVGGASLYYQTESMAPTKNLTDKQRGAILVQFSKLLGESVIAIEISPELLTIPENNADQLARKIYKLFSNDMVEFDDMFSDQKITNKQVQAYFPLAGGDTNGDVIIEKLVNYEGNLLLLNAISSPCTKSVKLILDGRKIKGYKTMYFSYIDDGGVTNCDMGCIIDQSKNYVK